MNLKPTFQHYYPEGTHGGQCAAFAEKLIKFGPVGNSLASKLDYLKTHGSTKLTDIAVGDVVITDDSKVYGHIFVVNNDLGDKWQATESNFNLDERVHHTRQVAKNSPHLKGHVRSSLLVPIINPPLLMQKILILTYKVPDPAFMESWVNYALNWLKTVTQSQLEIQVTYQDISTIPLTIISGPNSQNQIVTSVDPNQILDLAAPGYSIVTLIADYDQLSPRPTYDEAFPISRNGMTVSEKSALNPGGDLVVNASFLMHEWLHNWYYLLQQQGLLLIDDVHQHSTINDPNPQSNFSNIVNKLKPYWDLLTKKGENMIIVHKKSDPNTKFVLENEFKRGYADFPAFQKDTAGRQLLDIALDDVEFNKIPTSPAVIKS